MEKTLKERFDDALHLLDDFFKIESAKQPDSVVLELIGVAHKYYVALTSILS